MENYLAFISYRHIRPDTQVSAFLRKYLENWHLPPSSSLPRKRRVFRDTDELPTSTDLGEDIERALENSSVLIAVCSEEYVRSQWCMREIDRFMEMGRKDRILPVLISGTPETSIPPELKGLSPVLDLREHTRQGGHRLRKGVYDGIPRLLELISGTDEKDLLSSQRRFRTLVRSAAFGGIAALFLGLILYTTNTANRIAENNKTILAATEEAQAAELSALEKRDEAYLRRSSLLARKAQIAIGEGDDIAALQLSLEALPEDPLSDLPISSEAVTALRSALIMPDKQRNSYHFSERMESPAENDSAGRIQRGEQEGIPLSFADSSLITLPGALLEGYTDTLPTDAVYYGGEKQMLINSYPNIAGCLLNGKPFFAKKAWGLKNTGALFAGWDGKSLAVYKFEVLWNKSTGMEAYCSIPLEEEPIKVLFSESGQQLAVINADNRLTLYHSTDGRVVLEPEDTFLDMIYPEEEFQIYTLSTSGTALLKDSITGKVLAELRTPSPVKKLALCESRGRLLALCESEIAILESRTGELLFSLPLESPALSAAWRIPADGTSFLLTFEDHLERYDLDAAAQLSSKVSVPLTALHASAYNFHAQYSPDGSLIYLESNNGNLSAFDSRTGELLWINYSGWDTTPARRVACPLSKDGSALWRQRFDYTSINIDKVDASTGELLYTTDWGMIDLDGSRILESPDGRYGLVLGMYDDEPMILFDSLNGELKWKKESLGYTIFSEDGKTLLCLCAENAEGLSYAVWVHNEIIKNNGSYKKEDYTSQDLHLIYRIVSADTGKILKERNLGNLGSGTEGTIKALDKNYRVLANDQWEVDLRDGSVTICDPDRIAAFTQQEQTSRYPCIFAGQNAFVETTGKNTRLVSDPEGSLIMDAGERSLAVSPDGKSMVLYADSFTPLLIWDADTQTLIAEAREKLTEVSSHDTAE